MNSGMFDGCTNLTTVIIDQLSIQGSSISAYAFRNCNNLTTLVLKQTNGIAPLTSSTAFTNTAIKNGTGYIYVPSTLLSEYQSSTNWATYSAQFRAIEDYPDIVGG